MPANTANRGYTYATSDDANDLALISQRLAEQIDADVQSFANAIPAARAYRNTSQSIPNGSWTEVSAFSGETYRRGGVGYATPRYTANKPGVWALTGQVSLPGQTSGVSRRGACFVINGVIANSATDAQMVASAGTGGITVQVRSELVLSAGDTVGLAVFQDSGAAVSLTSAILTVTFMGN